MNPGSANCVNCCRNRRRGPEPGADPSFAAAEKGRRLLEIALPLGLQPEDCPVADRAGPRRLDLRASTPHLSNLTVPRFPVGSCACR